MFIFRPTLNRALYLLALLFAFALSFSLHAQVLRFSGSTAIGSSAANQTATIVLSTSGQIDSVHVRTNGSDGFDFQPLPGGSCTVGGIFAASQQCTVNVAFTPKVPGDRRGAVVLVDRNGTVLGTTQLDGEATGPVGTFIPGTISTVAGNAAWIYAGDGNVAVQSSIFLPFGLAVNALGDLFLADSSNNRIRKVDGATAVISTIAGNGNVGGTGDGGSALQATISNPTSVALDGAGNVYFADNGNNVIRKVNAFNGSIVTVAGTIGTSGYTGDGGPATLAHLHGPNGLSFDAAGNLYFADTGNNVVRMLSAATGLLSTVAGRGSPAYTGDGGPAIAASLNAPWSVTVTPAGELIIADQGNQCVRKVTLDGAINTVAGTGIPGFSGDTGPAAAAQLDAPASVVLDVAGNLYIADSGNNRVRKINVNTGNITTIAGAATEAMSGDNGPATAAGLYGPYALALDGQGSLFIADVFHNRIRKVSSNAATLVYPAMRVGRISATQTQALENDGNATLDTSSINAVTQSQVDPTVTTCSTATPLSTLDSCLIGVAFAPTVISQLDTGTVTVSSDAGNSPGTLTLEGQVLSVDPATVVLTSSLNPSTTGNSVVFTATTSSAGTTPTGTITLLDGTTVLTTTQVGVGGVAAFSTSTLLGGTHNLTASYSGDTNNTAAVSPVLVQFVKDIVADTTTSMASSANPVDAGASLRLIAAVQVATTGSGTGNITGSVTFKDAALFLGTAPLTNGAAILNVTTLSVAQHSLTATYNGSSAYGPSTSPAFTQRVQQATSYTALATSPSASNAGAPITLIATLTSTGGTPGGMVTFFDGTINLGSAPANSAGIASFAVGGTHWTVGTHRITASYAGDANDLGSLSPGFGQVVTIAQTSASLTSSLTPAGQGAAIVLTSVVRGNGGTPGGSVQFFDGPNLLGAGTLDANGQTTLSVATLALGAHNITATYSGDSFNAGSTSSPLAELINSASTAINLATNKNPANFGDAVTLTALLTGSGAIPTGTVTFTDAGTPLGIATLDANGNASFTLASFAIGSHNLLASYSGDRYHAALSSSVVVERVVQSTTTTLTSSTLHAVAGTSTQWTITVVGADGKPTTGPVVLLDGGTILTTLTTDASGTVSFSSTSLAPGRHSMSANFVGDPLDGPSTSAPLILTLDIAVTSTTLTSSNNPADSGSAVVFTSAVSGNGGTPSGTVVFHDGSGILGVASLNAAGIATLSTSTLAPGIHQITATYSGDTDDQPSTAPSLTQKVTLKTTVTIVSSANPSLLQDSVQLTVTVANGVPGATPTGIVTLTDNGTVIGATGINASGAATFTLTAPALGQHSLVATYSGDNQNVAATSIALLQTVNLRPTTNTTTSSLTALSFGQQVVLVSVVEGSGSRPATGSVIFSSGATVLGTAPINASGVATLTVEPPQAIYNMISTYSGDALYATSVSTPLVITVGPTIEFTITLQPPTMSVQSGQHQALQIAITTAVTFTDTLSLGCAGLPVDATCTFSENAIPVGGGLPKTLTMTVDTGNPLGAGASAQWQHGPLGTSLACMLPASALLTLLLRRRRFSKPVHLFTGILFALFVASGMTALTGCGSSLTVNHTAPGSYTFQVVGTGNTTGSTQRGTVQLTVTQ